MCSRYALATDASALTTRFDLPIRLSTFPSRFNVAPGQYLPIVVEVRGRQLDVMCWGLVPAWAKSASNSHQTINAPAETVAEHTAFRASLRYHRCLVPASGFYAWRRTARGKQPHYVHLPGEPLFAFAGLYDIWYAPDGTELHSYAIITTASNALLAPMHDRMPVILPREAEASWLDPAETTIRRVLPLLQPYPAAAMAADPVPGPMDDARSDGPALLDLAPPKG